MLAMMKLTQSSRRAGLAVMAVTLTFSACVDERAPERAHSFAEAIALELPSDSLPALRPLVAVGGRRTSGALVAARAGQETLLLVADSDAQRVRVIDPDTHRERQSLALRAAPAQIVIAGDGRAYVSLRQAGEVVALELDEELGLRETASIPVATEPIGLAVSPGRGDKLLVASGWGAKLAAFRVPARTKLFEMDVAREPRAVAVSADGAHAYVTHAIGSSVTRVALDDQRQSALSLAGEDHQSVRRRDWTRETYTCCFDDALAVDPDDRAPARRPFRRPAPSGLASREIVVHQRGAAQAFAIATVGEDVLIPGVLTHRGPSRVGSYGVGEGFPAHQPVITQIQKDSVQLRVDDDAFAPSHQRDHAGAANQRCLLPRAADSDGERLYVTCLGENLVMAYDARRAVALSASFEGEMRVPGGPNGIAVDTAGWVHVWSQETQTLSSMRSSAFVTNPVDKALVQPERMTQLRRGTGEGGLSPLAKRGRALFHAAGDRRIAADGRACASCHPDGRDDTMTWPTPSGPRQTPMLAGRLGDETSPYGWEGKASTIAAHLTQTFSRLGGTGLAGEDLDALLAYLDEMPTPAAPPSPRGETLARRGKELFFSEAVGCASCHRGGAGSDGSPHDVGSGIALDTPSLRFVGGTGPYFHDGRYATLGELLSKTRGKMGWAADMSDDDLGALEAYLKTL